MELPHPGRRGRAFHRGAGCLLLGTWATLVAGGPVWAAENPGLTITPSIGFNLAYTDDKLPLQKEQPGLVTQLSPSLSINGETAHTLINFNYQPVFNHFDFTGTQDRVDQNLASTGTIKLLENELTVDFQASANEAGASGNSSNEQGVIIPTANQILYYLGTVTPHLTEHYRDIATLDLIYSINSTNTSLDGKPSPLLQGITSSDSLGQDVELAIGSADSFGRLGLRLDFKHSDNTGSGPNNESTSGVDVLGVNYHIDRVYSATGSIGYQNIDYPARGGTEAYHSSGLTWSMGLSITPNELSSIQLGFGKQQGAYSPSIQAGYQLGPRTTLTASYLVTVQNQLTSVLQNSRFLTFDQFGNAIDSRTGLPFSAVNQSFGSQNVLFRDKPALISISHQFFRSSLSFSAQYEVRSSLSGPEMRNEVFGATLNYTRELSPLLQGNVRLAYTYGDSSGVGSLTSHNESISVSAALFYQLSDSTTVNVIANYFTNTSSLPDSNSVTEQLTIGVRKSF
jgi:uncharacterized protein (PEP-CTERM system associated)